MKALAPIEFDEVGARREVAELDGLVRGKSSLKEREDLLPFFRARPQLLALLGSFSPEICRTDRITWEFPLFGDYVCDFVAGDSQAGAFCLVEFEDAAPGGIFTTVKGRHTPEWSRRFERGFSQMVDWFHAVDDLKRTSLLRSRFGVDKVLCSGLLVIGRSRDLDATLRERFAWRSLHVVVQSRRVVCMTLDDLSEYLARKLALILPQPR